MRVCVYWWLGGALFQIGNLVTKRLQMVFMHRDLILQIAHPLKMALDFGACFWVDQWLLQRCDFGGGGKRRAHGTNGTGNALLFGQFGFGGYQQLFFGLQFAFQQSAPCFGTALLDNLLLRFKCGNHVVVGCLVVLNWLGRCLCLARERQYRCDLNGGLTSWCREADGCQY